MDSWIEAGARTRDGGGDIAGEVHVSNTFRTVQLGGHYQGRKEARGGVVQQLPAAVVVDAAPGGARPIQMRETQVSRAEF